MSNAHNSCTPVRRECNAKYFVGGADYMGNSYKYI